MECEAGAIRMQVSAVLHFPPFSFSPSLSLSMTISYSIYSPVTRPVTIMHNSFNTFAKIVANRFWAANCRVCIIIGVLRRNSHPTFARHNSELQATLAVCQFQKKLTAVVDKHRLDIGSSCRA